MQHAAWPFPRPTCAPLLDSAVYPRRGGLRTLLSTYLEEGAVAETPIGASHHILPCGHAYECTDSNRLTTRHLFGLCISAPAAASNH